MFILASSIVSCLQFLWASCAKKNILLLLLLYRACTLLGSCVYGFRTICVAFS